MIMATTAVGVRDLKLHAPKLVGRAARGERIVISRYGRPQAMLVPIEAIAPEAGAAGGSRMAEWLEEKRSFEQLVPRLEAKHRGRYVAIRGGRVVGSDPDHDRLFERLWQKLKGAAFFIGRVGGPPPIVEMPGFEVEG
jgi:prevent-host-death family protein